MRFTRQNGSILSFDEVNDLVGFMSDNVGLQDISVCPHPLNDFPWIQVRGYSNNYKSTYLKRL